MIGILVESPSLPIPGVNFNHRDNTMRNYLKFYINGQWVDPVDPSRTLDVINPATEASAGRISMGTAADVDRAAKAARAAFASYSQTSVADRVALLERIIAEYKTRMADMAAAITEEMGAPTTLAQRAQAAMGIAHLQAALPALGLRWLGSRLHSPARLMAACA